MATKEIMIETEVVVEAIEAETNICHIEEMYIPPGLQIFFKIGGPK